MRKVAFAIDGWFLRKVVYKTKAFYYNGSNIRRYCTTALRPDDAIYRIFYYDTEPLIAKGHNPITRNFIDFETTPVASGQKALLQSIRETPNFALRLGKTTWDKSWLLHPDKFKDLIDKKITAADLVESDVRPNIRQKRLI